MFKYYYDPIMGLKWFESVALPTLEVSKKRKKSYGNKTTRHRV